MLKQLNMFSAGSLKGEFEELMRMVPSGESDYATHNIHPYPAKFLPHFPRIFIRYLSKENDLVLDPMCGSGTTLIESCLQNRRAYGVDIDPIAALISRVSITPLEEEQLLDFEKTLFKKIHSNLNHTALGKVKLPSAEDFPNSTNWFREDILRELILVRDTILKLETDSALRDFVLLCLSMIVRPVSNADPRDIFPERDIKNPVREKREVVSELRRAFHDNRSRILSFSETVGWKKCGDVEHGDARKIGLSEASADLVFTSPPYSYAMDYARVHQLSTLLFVMDNDEFKAHRRRYIGTDRVSVNDALLDFKGFEFAQKAIEELYQHERKLAIILYQYFSDMHRVTAECMRVLKPGGILVYVIGNSTVRGIPFETGDVFVHICKDLGFKVREQLERPYYAYRMSRKRNVQSNTIKSDIFIIAEKHPSAH